MALGGWVGGWVGEWMDEWVGGRAGLRLLKAIKNHCHGLILNENSEKNILVTISIGEKILSAVVVFSIIQIM